LGLKSLNNIKTLIPHIFEIGLNNVHLEGGYLDGKLHTSSDVIEEIVKTIALEGTKLMKLKLTKMNLRHGGIITQISDILKFNLNMISLDLAFG